jgi:hypothetical protein
MLSEQDFYNIFVEYVRLDCLNGLSIYRAVNIFASLL